MHRVKVIWLDAMSIGAASKPTVMNDFSVQVIYTYVYLPDLLLAYVSVCVYFFYVTKKLNSNFT